MEVYSQVSPKLGISYSLLMHPSHTATEMDFL